MATSFPYLAVSKQYGVDYWRVLQFAGLLDGAPPRPADWGLPHLWMVATCLAWKQERDRRFDFEPPADDDHYPVIVTVRGDCGQEHKNVEEWQNCFACASISKSRRG